MGYCIRNIGGDFHIAASEKAAALAAAKRLMEDHSQPRGGGSWGSGRETSHYSWMNNYPGNEKIHSLEQMFEEWRYPLRTDAEGNVIGIRFDGEKIGQENLLFEVVAPYVRHNSFIEMVGEDGARWRWVFENGRCRRVEARVSY